MLRDRVITAILMFGVLLAALLLLSPLGWTLFAAALLLGGCWEWARLAKLNAASCWIYAVLLSAVGVALAIVSGASAAGGAATPLWPLYGCAIAFWAIGAPWWLRRLPQHPARILLLLIGALVMLSAYLAFVQLRNMHWILLLSFAALVWIADIAAYFSGRRFGTVKLAPSISPGKTRAGAYGAFIATALYALLWMALWPQFVPAVLAQSAGGRLWMLPLIVLLTLAAIVGDLFESALKRQAGFKDSGSIFPGHGGVLDRIDALLPVLPFAALVSLL